VWDDRNINLPMVSMGSNPAPTRPASSAI
jgi:hypothetical protein